MQQLSSPVARLIAFYLPQFHPIPQNDEWWGKGFTEWTNVAKAKQRFKGHQQPVIPADLGFYDLRVPEVRRAQAEMARQCGIEAFCYWHYWFGHGQRLLERPFNEVLASGEPDFPFCLAWANQSWTGIWHGNPKTVLMEQSYPGKQDEKDHFKNLLPAFLDRRYLRVNGKPMFVIFAPLDMPNPSAFIDHWRHLAAAAGLPGLYFVAIANEYRDPALAGFDAITPLTPQDFLGRLPRSLCARLLRKWKTRNFGTRFHPTLGSRLLLPARFDYENVVEKAFEDLPDEPRFHPCVLPNWDNTPRSGSRGVVFENSTPDLFRTYLAKGLFRVRARSSQERIVFLKAWNEWAEGNYVEPDLRFGHSYLEAIKSEMLPAPVRAGNQGAVVKSSCQNTTEPVNIAVGTN